MSADAPDPARPSRNEASDPGTPPAAAAAGRPLAPAARRALEEAQARRDAQPPAATAEQGGPSGPEPTRYGDWERKGIAVDF